MNPTLYEQDYYLWLEQSVQMLKEGRLADLDTANLIEEIADMGRREKNALESNLIILLLHLLKWQYQPEKRSGSWKSSIREHRRRILRAFQDSPSLKNYYQEIFVNCYREARHQAADETELDLNTFPKEFICNSDYLPS